MSHVLLSSSQCLRIMYGNKLKVQDVDSTLAALILRHPTGTLLPRLYSTTTLLSHVLLFAHVLITYC